ncbi:glycoside hydrolase family 15 protein [Microlunatus sp. Gsoil 973]|uniref:glycoside hydrolase family 15 protein n=1 Tax=Microlunatus sp. Gsoil 973 TaxID=2672569 RepID=UPI0012B5014E|nr:glycoside hydrolase family 15 protein [Microlunatus sp. Gsoil 973]QGN33400.1 glycoside hydrolase family 15 protein [Microlunatus sp. Gsoil 973]
MAPRNESARIEDYALIGDCRSAALISNTGSIDWLCLPRFDSPAVFAALLGTGDHGHWTIFPADEVIESSRRYLPDTFVLQSVFRTATGVVEVVELMPVDHHPAIIRRVTCTEGEVGLHQELVVRFGYGRVLPWMRRQRRQDDQMLLATAGPMALVLRGDQLPRSVGNRHVGEFTLREGESTDLVLQSFRSYHDLPDPVDVDHAIEQTTIWWQYWAGQRVEAGRYDDAVGRSLLVLRALTERETGGIVAAATTSLPEQFGGERNWDYRYCWLRDAALTLEALLAYGYEEETEHWRLWLLRAVAGDPQDIQIMYGLAGERDLEERTLDHLPGYQGSRPVRIGNGAVRQFQADVIGEVMVALDAARSHGLREDRFSWPLQRAMLSRIEKTWQQKDCGIWEIRGEPQFFTHSRVMNWAALDCGIRAVREYGQDGPVERWESLREQLREEIEDQGFDQHRGTYVQYYGSDQVDSALLQLPQVGFCPPDSERMLGTVAAIEEDLLADGLLLRYRTDAGVDGLTPGEAPFLACSFWLAEQYARSGRTADAAKLMARLLAFRNDLGLLSEEYDIGAGRQAGNTPQALSHLALVRAAGAINGVIGRRGRKMSQSR